MERWDQACILETSLRWLSGRQDGRERDQLGDYVQVREDEELTGEIMGRRRGGHEFED